MVGIYGNPSIASFSKSAAVWPLFDIPFCQDGCKGIFSSAVEETRKLLMVRVYVCSAKDTRLVLVRFKLGTRMYM